MDFSSQKKELINLKNTIANLDKNNQWVLDFSIVKLVSIWEQIIRNFSTINFVEIEGNNKIKVSFDKKRFYEFVWKSWLDGRQQNLANEKIKLQVRNVKRYSEVRNSVAHGNILKAEEELIISTINSNGSLLDKTLEILEEL